MSGGERDKRVCARGGKVGGKKTLEPSFPILQLRRTKLGLTESRHATPRVYTHTHTFTRTAEPILSPILYPSPPVYIFPRDGRRPMSHSTPLKCPRKSFSSPLANVFLPTFSRGPAFFRAFRAGIPPGYQTGRSSTIIIIAGLNRVTPIFTSHRNRPRTYT